MVLVHQNNSVMKTVIVGFVLWMAPSFLAPDMVAITNALKSGDVDTLSEYFDEDIELAFGDVEDLYSKDEAKALLAKYFSKHKPSSFSPAHQGKSRGADSHYVIGDLVMGGKTYRTYLHMMVTDDKYIIQELRIED